MMRKKKRELTKNGTKNMVQGAEVVSDRKETESTSRANLGIMTMSCPRWAPMLMHTMQLRPLFINQNNEGKQMLENDPVTHTILTQYHVSKGLKVFGEEGTNNVLSELKQLHDRM
eukprot:3774869-Ditylum_brightwellii.AAC.1